MSLNSLIENEKINLISSNTGMPVNLPCIVDFVCRKVLSLGMLFLYSWCLQLPVIKTMQEHFGQVMHYLPFSLWKVTKLVDDKVQDRLREKGSAD